MERKLEDDQHDRHGQSLDHGGLGVVDDDLARADVDDDGGQSWRPVEDLTK